MQTIKKQENLISEISNHIKESEQIDIKLSPKWLKQFDRRPATYCILNEGKIVYTGETKNIRKRMNNLFHTTQHVLRRNIGEKKFSNEVGYEKASPKKKYIENIEKLVNEYIEKKLKLKFYYTTIGRKEVEEYIIKSDQPSFNK